MPREVLAILDDIVLACFELKSFRLRIPTLETLRTDPLARRAVERNLEIIGEAVKSIPASLLSKYPHIPWRNIAGMRDLLIHAYFNVDIKILWDVLTDRIDDLHQAAVTMREEEIRAERD